MKSANVLITLIATIFSFNVFATEIKSCSIKQLTDLNESILSKNADGYINTKLMINSKGQTVGFYSWNKDGDSMFAEICEYVATDELTVSSEWYYWNDSETPSNPAEFKKGLNYRLSQDEGIADIKVLNSSSSGQIKFLFSIIGWDDKGEKIVRKSILTLK